MYTIFVKVLNIYSMYTHGKCFRLVLQVQFVLVTAHIGQFFLMKDCPYQFPVFLYVIGLYGLIFLVLFLNFYYHAYTQGKRLPKGFAQNGSVAHKKEQ